MGIEIRYDDRDIDWQQVADLLRSVNMGYYHPDLHQKAFANSYVKSFVFDNGQLIGCGRAVFDGAYQAALYDCAIQALYQGWGLGKQMVEGLLARLPPCNVMLYATPGKEGFYAQQGFQRLHTGMARFLDPETMACKGFIE